MTSLRAILTYHSIDDSGSVISVSPGRFAEHVQWLASGAVPVLPVTELLVPGDDRPAIGITFDDGFTNFATAAWPLLRDSGLPVTLFVPTRHVGKSNQWESTPGGAMPSLPLLDWNQLGQLAAEGVTLGAHSRTHADLRQLSGAALTDEVGGSFEDIAHETGLRPDGFAYPYGFHNQRVVDEVRRTCTWACTTVLGPLTGTDDAHLIPRLDAYFLRGPAELRAFGSRMFRSYLRARATIRRFRAR